MGRSGLDTVRAHRDAVSAPGRSQFGFAGFSVPLSVWCADKGYGDTHGQDTWQRRRPDRICCAAATARRWPRCSNSIASGSGAWWSSGSTGGCAPGRCLRCRPGRLPRRRPRPRRLPGRSQIPPLFWLRLLVGRRLTTCTASTWARRCGTPGRRSRSTSGPCPEASSAALASMLLGQLTSPTQAADPGRADAPAPGGPE